jgi:hypothetical protein
MDECIGMGTWISLCVCPLLDGGTIHYTDLYTQLSYSLTWSYSTKSYYYALGDGRGLTIEF